MTKIIITEDILKNEAEIITIREEERKQKEQLDEACKIFVSKMNSAKF